MQTVAVRSHVEFGVYLPRRRQIVYKVTIIIQSMVFMISVNLNEILNLRISIIW